MGGIPTYNELSRRVPSLLGLDKEDASIPLVKLRALGEALQDLIWAVQWSASTSTVAERAAAVEREINTLIEEKICAARQ
jgi:hypothetical protein